MALVAALLATFASEGLLRSYLHYKGVGRGDLAELLKKSAEAGPKVLHGGTGLYGLVQPSTYADVVYELRPNQSGSFVDARVTINSHGLRGHEISLAKPARVFRIAGIGDSHMFGWGVTQGETYLERLERKLNHARPGRPVEVLNFAAPGYNTAMEVSLFLNKALRFEPDMVILHFIGNDVYAPHFIRSRRTWHVRDWYLTELTRILLDRPESDRHDEAATARRWQSDEYGRLSGSERFREAMESLRDACRERGIPVVFLVLGAKGGYRDWVVPYAAELGFQVLEASSTFAAQLAARGLANTEENWRQVFDGRDEHPSSRGHAAYAEALYTKVMAMGVLDR